MTRVSDGPDDSDPPPAQGPKGDPGRAGPPGPPGAPPVLVLAGEGGGDGEVRELCDLAQAAELLAAEGRQRGSRTGWSDAGPHLPP